MHHCMRAHYVYWVWHSIRLLDFNGGCDEALETGGVYLSYSLQSGKETLCTAHNQARRLFVQHAIKQVLKVIRFRRCHLIPIGHGAPAMRSAFEQRSVFKSSCVDQHNVRILSFSESFANMSHTKSKQVRVRLVKSVRLVRVKKISREDVVWYFEIWSSLNVSWIFHLIAHREEGMRGG
jgi:hypothetical protein